MMNYSKLPADEFLTHPETVWYFVCNVIFYAQTVTLPGIVEGIPNVMNGSLWTLNSEVRAYFLLGLVAAFNAMNDKVIATTTVTLIVLVGYLNFGDLPTQLMLTSMLGPYNYLSAITFMALGRGLMSSSPF